MLFGWISCETNERGQLLALGITLGKYDRTMSCYRDCMVPEEAEECLREIGSARVIFLLDEIEEGGTQ